MARRTQSSRILRSRQVAACDGSGAATMQGLTADSGYGLLRMDSSVAVPCAPHTHRPDRDTRTGENDAW